MSIRISHRGICSVSGRDYPAVGYGTFPLKGSLCVRSVKSAIEAGYRIIDTATYYQNLISVGEAIRAIPRDDIYLISKVWPDSQTPKALKQDLHNTLKEMNIESLDAYFLHWPNHLIPIEDTLGAMVDLRNQGLIQHIGMSNVTINHLQRVKLLNIPISWVQIEMNPLFYDEALIDYCNNQGIGVQAWGPLARGRIYDDLLLKEIAQTHGKTIAQVALRWIIQHQCVPLPGSSNETHIKNNIKAINFSLSDKDMTRINEQAKSGTRERVTKSMQIGFTDEFDFLYEECWPQ